MTKRIDLNFGWEFTETFSDAFAKGAACDTVAVDLPHTSRMLPFNGFDESLYQMDAGYRKILHVPANWQGKRVFLCVGAAAHRSEVYLNGKRLSEHRCGYTAFRTELTAELRPGEDVCLVIRADSREQQDFPPFGFVIDYMTYGGLYREVWLEVREQSFLSDVFAKPRIPEGVALLNGTEDRAQIAGIRFAGTIESEISVEGSGSALRQRVYPLHGEDGKPLVEQTFPLSERVSLTLPDAALWDAVSPTLYVLETELLDSDQVLDRMKTVVGFRRAEFRQDGFYLNGRKFKLVGLNRHQSYPYTGYAMPASVQRFDADILKKELGVNAVRTSHYPQSPHFIDRCDELGLLVFTEIPGWQHIGGAAWQDQAVQNTEDMILQYRNHPSIILWGVRINESQDNDALYARTTAAARRLDDTRQLSGVRCIKNSSLLEDVYAYNDFVHDGTTRGCEPKKAVTSHPEKPYFISEYNGHMFPTKSYDSEEHRQAHALRHATVLDAVAGEQDIAGCFGWCMFDYNTHRDFGSGDRICYHGVTDMFRNPKIAAAVYASFQDETPVLEVSSSMDIGERPAGNRGRVFVFTNADEVRFYKNDRFIRAYTHRDSPYHNLRRPPIEIDDYIGDQIQQQEHFSPRQAKLVKDILNYSARFGSSHLPLRIKAKAGWLMLRYRMNFNDAYALFGKYIGDWGNEAISYRFDAVKDGKVVKSVRKAPMTAPHLWADTDHCALLEGATYDAAMIRIRVMDQNDNVLPFSQEIVRFETSGPIAVIGPQETVLRGGMGGTFVRTTGGSGPAVLTIVSDRMEPVTIEFQVTKQEEAQA